MNEILYLTITLILSNSQMEIIYSKVSVEEYKAYKIGTYYKKTYKNSVESLTEMEKDSKSFYQYTCDQYYLNLSTTDDGGVFGKFTKGGPRYYTNEDLAAYKKAKGLKELKDEDYIRFIQDTFKNVSRGDKK